MIELLPRRTPFDPPPGRLRRGAVPIASVLLGSMMPILPLVADAPLVPSLGFVMLLAWRLLRPDLWPVWIGLPLGAFDDLFSGQPLGSAAAIWTAALLVIDQAEQRLVFRDKWQDWALAALLLGAQIPIAAAFARLLAPTPSLPYLLPQALVAILLFPLASRLAAGLDRWRLAR